MWGFTMVSIAALVVSLLDLSLVRDWSAAVLDSVSLVDGSRSVSARRGVVAARRVAPQSVLAGLTSPVLGVSH
jgi:hypothetical protein